jgi:membrane peptidoglycan carboxypeptidase
VSTDFTPRGRRSGYDVPEYDEPRSGRSRYDAPDRPRYDNPRPRHASYGTPDGYDDPRPRRFRHGTPDEYDEPRHRATATRAMRAGGGPRHGGPDGTRLWSGGGRRRAQAAWLGRGGGGGRFSRFTWKRLLGYAAIASGGGIAIVAGLTAYTYAKTPIPSAASQFALSQQSTVYFDDGKTEVGSLGDVNRQILQPDQILPVVQNAVLAAEDRNYYHEGGVSPTGIMRAVYADLTGGGIQQGGSTITQEFVRNYYANIGTQQTFTRKFKEIFVATKVAKRMSKSWILTQYLNTIDFGRAWGIGAASEAYFGKPVESLDVAHAAVLAAIIQLPNYYSTPAAAVALQQRWNYVLDGMEKMGTLNAAQRPTTMPKFIAEQQNNSWSGYRGYIMEAVDYELKTTYGYTESQLDNGGLKVVTTFNKSMEDAAYNAVQQNEAEMKAAGAPMPRYAHVGMTVIQPSGPNAGGVVATYSGKNWAEDPQDCAKDYCQEDMALAARNQVGSSFKPYVLATAVHQGISIRSTLDGRSPLCIPPDSEPTTPAKAMPKSQCGQPNTPYYNWYPVANDTGDIPVSKPADMTAAIAYSLNTAFVDLTHQIGTDNVIKMAESLGVDPNSLKNYEGDTGIAIGIASLSSEEQASTFATFANGGTYVTPHVIRKITDGSGNNVPLKITRTQLFTPQQAGAIDYALSKDVVYGTAVTYGALSDGREVIAKTGTTEKSQAAWFVGAIPQYSVAVGMFTNTQSQTLNGVGGLPGYGGDWPAKIWHTFAEAKLVNLPIENFPQPYLLGRLLNEIPPQTKPKPKPTPTRQEGPKPKQTCDPFTGLCGGGHGHHNSAPPCLPGDPTCSTPSQPTSTPTPTFSFPGGGGGGPGGGGGGGAATGGLGTAVDPRRMGGG